MRHKIKHRKKLHHSKGIGKNILIRIKPIQDHPIQTLSYLTLVTGLLSAYILWHKSKNSSFNNHLKKEFLNKLEKYISTL